MQKFFNYITLKFYRFINKVIGTKLLLSADGEDAIIKKFFQKLSLDFTLI